MDLLYLRVKAFFERCKLVGPLAKLRPYIRKLQLFCVLFMLKELALFFHCILLTSQLLNLYLVTILHLLLLVFQPGYLLEELVDVLVALQ